MFAVHNEKGPPCSGFKIGRGTVGENWTDHIYAGSSTDEDQ